MKRMDSRWRILALLALGWLAADRLWSAPVVPAITARLATTDAANVEPSLPVAVIPRLAQAPIIDGVCRSDEWAGAYQSAAFLVPTTTNPANPATAFRMGLDDRCLYLAFHCGLSSNQEPRATATQHDGAVWSDDSIELFIWPDGAKPVFCQLIVNSTGISFDQRCAFDPDKINAAGSSDTKWNPAWEVKTGREPGAWILEAALPWSSLAVNPTNHQGLRLNCCRNTVPGPNRLSSWAYLPSGGFHQPAYFGIGLCAFDPQAPLKIGLRGLGTFGVWRTKRLSRVYPPAAELAVLCDLPRHPFFAAQKIRLTAEFVPLDADAELGQPLALGQFEVTQEWPQQFVAQGLQATNGVVRLTCDYGVTQTCSFIVLNQALGDLTARLGKEFQPAKIQQEPFRAAACLGAAAALEKLKRQIHMAPLVAPVQFSWHEVRTRLDVLAGQPGFSARPGLLDLLSLAQIPEAGVSVQYSIESANYANVFFNWGSIPLAAVSVRECGSPENALAALKHISSAGLAAPEVEELTVAGCPARLQTRSRGAVSSSLEQYNPARQVLLIGRDRKFGQVVATQELAAVKANAVALLADCPEPVRSQVKAWAQEKNLPLLGLDDAFQQPSVILAGDVSAVSKQLAGYRWRALAPVPDGFSLTAAAGQRLISVRNAPCRSLAEQAAQLVIRGRPVSVADVDALRSNLVARLAPKSAEAAKPDGLKPYCGDVHMHTFFSDGKLSPVGLALEALYCQMDFAAITDHNQLTGAQLAQRLFARHGFAWALIVGEEISTPWAHLNAYPLTEVIPAALSPADTVAAAHRQGAVIQWNHPGFTSSEWESSHLTTGLVGTGCDAWEHYTPHFQAWRAAGQLPVMVGSSDTHEGIFAAERTLVWASSPQGADVAEAVRQGRVVMISQQGTEFFYGAAPWVARAWAALADGQPLKAAKAEQLKTALAQGDLVELLQESPNAPAPSR